MTHIIDGKKIASDLQESLKQQIESLKKTHGITPYLVVIIVGDDPASQVYVASKEKTAKNIGMESSVIRLPETTSQQKLNETIIALNTDKNVHGILVKLPLTKHLNDSDVINLINPQKDVDRFHPMNVGF